MQRSFSTPCLILGIKNTGENNSKISLLTPQRGILYAILYGGPKSRMKSLVSQFNIGKIWLYENPEKDQIKITDFEVSSYHNSFSQSLFKMFAASLVCELAIKTQCAGSNESTFKLLSGFLDGMELCNEEQSRLGLLRYLWRYIELLGIQPQTHACSMCGKSFIDSQIEKQEISYYNYIENCFVCSSCNSQESAFKINNSAIQYLTGITVLSPSESRKLKIDKNTYEQIKHIVFFLIQNNLDLKLNSIETGMGIL